ncbi:MAG: GrpB family protein [Candidatus Dormibacteraeota bacterium]|nr:GrpB family protein [Candidatus Dormibacteraeota bacterium]MBV9526718.1 GrpB family protein [Candidatus Dormibacteraeota bacterium]
MPLTDHDAREGELRAATIGGEPERLDGPVHLAEYDPAWPAQFLAHAERIREALGARALAVEHAGSTAVPGLAAKPVIDIVLSVADSRDEAAYVPALEAAGYTLRIREPGWYEHRLLRGTAPAANVHVFSSGCPEVARMLALRDRLRASEADRALYESAKRDLAARTWRYMQDYADAKSAVVAGVVRRAGVDPS